MLGGLGLVWAGIFPWKMVDGVPTETAPHVIGAIMVFTATGLAGPAQAENAVSRTLGRLFALAGAYPT